MSETERRELIFNAYKKFKTSFEKFKKPNGEKDNPAKTCKDLYAAYPDLESGRKMFLIILDQIIKYKRLIGEYWVDPNEGDVRDAVLVRCDQITKSTCVKSQPDHIGPIDFENRSPQPEIWLSEFGYTGQVVNNGEKL